MPKHIDYLSLDVEGAEDKIVASFPFETHTIAVLSVEVCIQLVLYTARCIYALYVSCICAIRKYKLNINIHTAYSRVYIKVCILIYIYMQGPKPFAIATLLRNGYVPLASHQNDVFFVHPSIEDLEGVLARLGVCVSIYLI